MLVVTWAAATTGCLGQGEGLIIRSCPGQRTGSDMSCRLESTLHCPSPLTTLTLHRGAWSQKTRQSCPSTMDRAGPWLEGTTTSKCISLNLPSKSGWELHRCSPLRSRQCQVCTSLATPVGTSCIVCRGASWLQRRKEGERRGWGTSCYPTKNVVCLHQSQFSTCVRTIQSLGNLGHVLCRAGLLALCTSILKTQEELLRHLHTCNSRPTHPSQTLRNTIHALHHACTCSTVLAYMNAFVMQVRQEGTQQATQSLDVTKHSVADKLFVWHVVLCEAETETLHPVVAVVCTGMQSGID